MQRRTWLAALLLAAPASTLDLRSARAADPAPSNQITIDNFTFAPDKLTVPAGTTITWINRDDIPHTIVGQHGSRLMKSPVLDTDDSFSFTFPEPGTYGYFCSLHPHMQGTVVVR